ncbi:uncharacterized protein [Montipora capricornis]|uniref:uncharacterized protein n=1 Tax=Montipora capricornis TaxID=246305 RepID=UPI0035F11B96
MKNNSKVGNYSQRTDSYGAQSSMREEKQANDKALDNALQNVKRQGYFNSKFDSRTPLSLHHPISMETEISSLLFKAREDESATDFKQILSAFEKARSPRNQTSLRKHLNQKGNETHGEKAIKLALEKNTLPEAIKRRTETHFYSSCFSIFEPNVSSRNEEVEDSRARSSLAWSRYVFPATLMEFPRKFPERKTVISCQPEQKRERIINRKKDTLKPATYRDFNSSVQRQSSGERTPSQILYPLHHGH